MSGFVLSKEECVDVAEQYWLREVGVGDRPSKSDMMGSMSSFSTYVRVNFVGLGCPFTILRRKDGVYERFLAVKIAKIGQSGAFVEDEETNVAFSWLGENGWKGFDPATRWDTVPVTELYVCDVSKKRLEEAARRLCRCHCHICQCCEW